MVCVQDMGGGSSQPDDDGEEAFAHALNVFAAAAAGGQASGGVAPQKWVQCASCNKWRKVPPTFTSDIPNSTQPGLPCSASEQSYFSDGLCAQLGLTQPLGVLQVPFDLNDDDIAEDWSCEHNVWDEDHQSCSVPQALSDEQIDEILALQEVQEVRAASCPG